MARCPHNNVQQFTECCMDCGRNIYETDEEYYKYLVQEKQRQNRKDRSSVIERLEQELGIKHAGNSGYLDGKEISGYGGPQGGW